MGRVGRTAPAAAVAVLLVSVALLIAGCGSSKSASGASTAKVSASAYAKSLCDAVGPFEQSVSALGVAFDKVGKLPPATGKTKLVSFLTAVGSDTGAAVSKLKAAGIPEVTKGATFAKAMLNTFTRLQGTLGRSVKVAQQLSTTSETSFRSGAQQLLTAVKESVGEIVDGLSNQSNKQLNAAAAKVPACHSI